MAYLLFTLYFAAGCFIIYRLPMIRHSGLHVRYWLLFFVVKVAAGCFYGYWYSLPKNFATSDTWRFHHQALEEYRLLLEQPTEYLLNIFYNNDGSGLVSTHGYWNNLKDNVMLKLISLMDVLSAGHYYVNVVIYSFITFFGFVFFYLACKNALHRTPSHFTAIAILITPSCLFWTSGIHRDGFMLLLIGLIFYQATRILYVKAQQPAVKTNWSNSKLRPMVIVLLSLSALFFIRNYVAILLLPWLLTLGLIHQFSIRPAMPFCLAAILCMAFFFLSPLIHPALDVPSKLVERRNAFNKLSGTSRMPDLPITPEPQSFIIQLPKAADHALFRPYIWQARGVMEKMAALELMLIIIGMAALLTRERSEVHQDAVMFNWMIVFFCISVFIVIGYTIPFSGAVVRYRAVFLMLMLAGFTLRFR